MKGYLSIICFFALFLSTNVLKSQEKDSFLNLDYSYLHDKFISFINSNKDSSLIYANAYYRKAKNQSDWMKTIDGKLFIYTITKKDNEYLSFLDSIIGTTKPNPNYILPSYAYIQKGRFFISKGIYDKSLSCYLKALEAIKTNPNDNLEIGIKKEISLLRSINGDYNEAVKMCHAVRFHCRTLDNANKRSNDLYISSLINLSLNYLKLEKIDSANYYNKKAYKFASYNNKSLKMYSIYHQGVIEYHRKNYYSAIDSLENSINSLINNGNYIPASNAYRHLGKSHEKIGNYKKALKNYFLLDSLTKKENIFHESQKDAYIYIINHFEEKNDLKNQLKYIEKLLATDSILNAVNKNLNKKLFEDYDKPKLVAEKQRIINELKSNLSLSNIVKYGFAGAAILTLFLFLFQYNRRKKLNLQFKKLTNDKKEQGEEKKKEVLQGKERLNISKEVINMVLKKLLLFEKNNEFINPNLSLSFLANSLETNSNYLSKIINHYKGVSFSNYINELRINYILQLLDSNPKIRKYSIKGLAEEAGYKNSESFSNAFYKKTKLKPSYYIKQLEKLEK